MALEEYKRKRDFKKTPEPAGRAGQRRSADLEFVVQKHAARRLHYDFRLELGGVMKSWAVPKGPSLDPREKRLAVHTEDHPMEYNSFEGVIPEGEYGGGTVLLWDRGTWAPTVDGDAAKAYEKGSLKFELHGEKLHGRWALVRMGGRDNKRGYGKENWLLIKEKDEVAAPGSGTTLVDENPLSVDTGRDLDAIAGERDRIWRSNRADAARQGPDTVTGAKKGRMPRRLEPELATLVAAAPRGEDWLHEIKFDGYRILAFIEDGKVRLMSRNGLDWTSKFSNLARQLGKLPIRAALIDGEAVALDKGGHSSFSGLQEALSAGDTEEVVYYAFDLVHLDGWNLAEAKLEDRKALLKPLLPQAPDGTLRYSDHQLGEGGGFYRGACEMKLEGVISKRRDASYRPGRNRAWVKVKCLDREEFVVVGWTDPGGSRVGFGALVLGQYRDGKLVYVSRVGTGFDDKLLGAVRKRLDRVKEVKKPFRKLPPGAGTGVHWIDPSLVAEIQFTGKSRDGSLRHPVFLGFREDKAPHEAVPEEKQKVDPEPAARRRKAGTVEIAGVRLSNPAKILYPGQKITKEALARYYEAVAEWALPHLAHRPLTLVRCPDGEGRQCFYQKHVGSGVLPAIGGVEIAEKEGGTETYLEIEDVAGLVSLVQMGVLEAHPWGSTVDAVERPDRLIFDLDPDVGLSWSRIVEAALGLRDLLGGLGLTTFAKTTGGKGLHVVLPVKSSLDWEQAKGFTKAVAEAFAAAQPDRYTAVMAKKARKDRLFIDYLRNGRGNTAVGAFSTRARPGAPVSVPLTWEEVEAGIRSDAFTIATVPQRLKKLKRDPWEGWGKATRQSLESAIRKF